MCSLPLILQSQEKDDINKSDVKEVKCNFECGLSIENFHSLQEKDLLEIYEIQVETKV